MITPNIPSYFRSLADELSSQQNRVRDLIGSRHWGHDGRHKELLLGTLLTRHLPSTVLVASGFVINPFMPDSCSREQDIMVIDVSREGPLFSHGGLAIVNPRQLLASISVKTTASSDTVQDAIHTLHSAHAACDTTHGGHKPWFGAYFYALNTACTNDAAKLYEYTTTAFRTLPVNTSAFSEPFTVPAICIGGDHLLRSYLTSDSPPINTVEGRIAQGVAAAAFIAEIVDHVSLALGGAHAAMADGLDSLALEPMRPSSVALP